MANFYVDYIPVPRTSTGRLITHTDKKSEAPLDNPDNLGHIPDLTDEQQISMTRHLIHWAIVNGNEGIENIYGALGLLDD